MGKEIIVRLCGGIGNQLFSYSAARRLALANNYDLVIDNISGFKFDYEYQRSYQLDHFNIPCRTATASERFEPFGRMRRWLARSAAARKPFLRRRYIFQEIVDFDSRILHFKPSGRTYLEGYWQSEGYFIDVEHQIREDLRITPPRDKENCEVAHCIRNRLAVAIHVRFFDLPQRSPGVAGVVKNVPFSYYRAAIEKIEKIFPTAHFFVFSDRPDDALARLLLDHSRATLVNHNNNGMRAYADLWLMSQCQHFIIANSTFSWWGAWLSTNKNKVVVAPNIKKNNFGPSWGFDGLIPSSWVKL